MGMSSIRKIEIEEKEEKKFEECQSKQLSPIKIKRKVAIEIDDISPKLPKVETKKMPSTSLCAQCDKKLKFISTFECRCGNVFCASHRFYDQHKCTYDYKNNAKKLLSQ